jgi:hypothetical protein
VRRYVRQRTVTPGHFDASSGPESKVAIPLAAQLASIHARLTMQTSTAHVRALVPRMSHKYGYPPDSRPKTSAAIDLL